jgi:hypothetical protein
VKIFLLGLILALGCTGDHVVGSTTDTPDGPMSADAPGSSDGNNMSDGGSIDGPVCGGRRQPCCTTGMPCEAGLTCSGGTCR